MLIPAMELAKTLPVYLVAVDDFLADPRLSAIGGAAAVVFRKLSISEVLAGAQRLHYAVELLATLAEEQTVVADMSDDYAAAPEAQTGELGDYQRQLLSACPITVPCEALAARLRPFAKHGVHVIEDPFEGPHGTPRAPRSHTLRVCWFGNAQPAQLDALERAVMRLQERAVIFEVVTNPAAAGFFAALAERFSRIRPEFRLRFTPWSQFATSQALRECDMVLLPQDSSAWGLVKSHNRLVEALRAGRFAIASPIPSYNELAAYAWVAEDPAAGVEWALDHTSEVLERVRLGQEHLVQRFSPTAVAHKWAATLGIER
jgi:glycosyltransferase involved in cell wall biosynthesis